MSERDYTPALHELCEKVAKAIHDGVTAPCQTKWLEGCIDRICGKKTRLANPTEIADLTQHQIMELVIVYQHFLLGFTQFR